MTDLKKIFHKKSLPADEFVEKIMYDKNFGYYSSKNPFHKKGDYVTAPNISNIFSEIILIWLVFTWKKMGSPKQINIVELGPGSGEMINVILNSLQNFPAFKNCLKIYLFEKSERLKKKQNKLLKKHKIKWISSFKSLRKGPIIFLGNEFFDAIPIKQFLNLDGILHEKYYILEKNSIKTKYLKSKKKDRNYIKKFKSTKSNKFFEFPLMGFKLLDKILNVIKKNRGGILLVDYGYTIKSEVDTIQSIKNHKFNSILNNLGNADVTSLVNFKLLTEYFKKNRLIVNKVISQEEFLKSLGIIERANILSKNMTFKEKSNLYYRVNRLIDPKQMGNLFKVIFAYSKNLIKK